VRSSGDAPFLILIQVFDGPDKRFVQGSAKDTYGVLDSMTTGFLWEVLKMVERFHSSSQSALDAATTVDSPAQFLGPIIRKLKALIRPLLSRVARMAGRVFGR
jgi:hypothetical protein